MRDRDDFTHAGPITFVASGRVGSDDWLLHLGALELGDECGCREARSD